MARRRRPVLNARQRAAATGEHALDLPGQHSPQDPAGPILLKAVLGSTVIAEMPLSIVTTLTPRLAILEAKSGAIADYPRTGEYPHARRIRLADGPVTILRRNTGSADDHIQRGLQNGPDNARRCHDEETLNVTATDGAITAVLDPPINLQGV